MRTAIGLIMIIIVIGVLGVIFIRRRTRDEIHSIDHYRGALDTLQEMRGPAGSSVRILDEEEAKSLRQPSPQTVIRSSTRIVVPPMVGPPPAAEDGMAFADDGSPADQTGDSSLPPTHHGHLGHHSHDDPAWAMARMSGRPPMKNRELLAAGGAVAVILVLIVVGVLIGRSSGGPTTHTTTTTTVLHHTTTTKKQATTTTTLPSTFAPQPGATATSATYLVPGDHYTVVVTATTGACWTIATSGAGSQLFAGTISPGSPQQIQGTSGLQVSLGAPGSVTVQINGVPVTFPPAFSTPLVLTFQAPPAPTTTTTTTVPVTTTAPTTTTPGPVP